MAIVNVGARFISLSQFYMSIRGPASHLMLEERNFVSMVSPTGTAEARDPLPHSPILPHLPQLPRVLFGIVIKICFCRRYLLKRNNRAMFKADTTTQLCAYGDCTAAASAWCRLVVAVIECHVR